MTKSDLITKVFKKCYEISTNSKCDVFFDYSPHCDIYSIYYYLNGWDTNSRAIYLHPNQDTSSDITVKNLRKTIKELNKLWESIEENNSKIN